jgi:hypothetical protein
MLLHTGVAKAPLCNVVDREIVAAVPTDGVLDEYLVGFLAEVEEISVSDSATVL